MNGTNGTEPRRGFRGSGFGGRGFRGGYVPHYNYNSGRVIRFENPETGKVVAVIVIVIIVLVVIGICISTFCGQGQAPEPAGDQIHPVAFQLPPGVPVQALPPQMQPSPQLQQKQNPQHSQQHHKIPHHSQQTQQNILHSQQNPQHSLQNQQYPQHSQQYQQYPQYPQQYQQYPQHSQPSPHSTPSGALVSSNRATTRPATPSAPTHKINGPK